MSTELHRAIALCGGQLAFAKQLTDMLAIRGENRIVSQQSVSYWLSSTRGLPSIYCLDVEKMLSGVVSRHSLRPDIFGRTPYSLLEEKI